MNNKYITPEKASQLLNVTTKTLINWNKSNKINCIRTKGNHRRYILSEIINSQDTLNNIPHDNRRKICYCRVSSFGQKNDLLTQEEFFKNKYPTYEIIKDYGSGLNFNRKGLNIILNDVFNGNISEVIVTHKDRLCRFGFELLEKFFAYHNSKIIILNNYIVSPETELTNDLISIITCFSSKIYGLRSHKIKNTIKEIKNKMV